jgi:hypothetical protein
MLKDDPPSGTTVRFIRVKANETARLVRALAKYLVERPEDQFEVEFHGERLIVQRQDIE